MKSPDAGLPTGLNLTQVQTMFTRKRTNRTQLETAWDGLIAAHGGEWVVSESGRFVFGRSLEDAMQRAEESGFDLATAGVGHLVSHESPMLR